MPSSTTGSAPATSKVHVLRSSPWAPTTKNHSRSGVVSILCPAFHAVKPLEAPATSMCSLYMARMYCTSMGPTIASMPAAKSLSGPNLPRMPLKLGSCVNLECSSDTSLLTGTWLSGMLTVGADVWLLSAAADDGSCCCARVLDRKLVPSRTCSPAAVASLSSSRNSPL